MRLISTFCLMLTLVLAGTAHAHIGEKVFLIFEIPDADLGDLDLFDADISDWEDVVGDASLTPADFFADPTVGDGAQYDPADMDYRVWLGWNNTNNRLYLAAEAHRQCVHQRVRRRRTRLGVAARLGRVHGGWRPLWWPVQFR